MYNIKKRIKERIKKSINQRLHRLSEAEPGEVFLNQRRIFIVPTRVGWTFGVMLLVLFISAMNYNVILGFALTFFLASCAIVDMYLTFRNLAHLYLLAGHAHPVFAGEEAQFQLHLINRKKYDRYAILLSFMGNIPTHSERAIDIAACSSSNILLSTPTVERGWLAAPRVRLRTRFPLGLLRAWGYWRPDAQILVYPYPEQNPPPLPTILDAMDIDEIQENKEMDEHAGQGDFAGIRVYQTGDSIKHLAWRQIARIPLDLGGPLLSKHFEENADGINGLIVLDFATLPIHMPLEMKLSRMTSWVIMADIHGLPYGFCLGDTIFAPAIGSAHKQACLQALALYKNDPNRNY